MIARYLTVAVVLPCFMSAADDQRRRVAVTVPAGHPVLFAGEMPGDFKPDQVRVAGPASPDAIPSKVEWRNPSVRISWISRGPGVYQIAFEEGGGRVEPAMTGTGDRVTYGRAGVRGNLAVGLWAFPAAIDMDSDGDLDLIVSCAGRPYRGIYLFRNTGSNAAPVFARGEWMGDGKKDLVAADFNGDGAVDLVISGGYYSDVKRNRLRRFVSVNVPRSYHVGRDDLWHPADWDGDGRIDLLIGVSDWREYGWDDAFDDKGAWTRGPLHGYVYVHRNIGTNDVPAYAPPVMLQAGGKPIDLYGSPAPNPVDWFGRGRLDLVGGSFLDTVTLFENTGTRTGPVLAGGRKLAAGGKPVRMDLCMIQPRVVHWHSDKRPSLLVTEEDGTVTLFRNVAPNGEAPRLAAGERLQQVDPYLKSGALARPVAVDWNEDGRLDLVAGNSAGYVQYFENTGSRTSPAFADRGYVSAGGKTLRIMAGPNGSIQGPAEEKWGYTNPWVADWDLDGRLDLLVNSIWGEVLWFRNTGARGKPVLSAAMPVEVAWLAAPPKPEWNWWNPRGKQLVTQWRTTPRIVDWNRDGLPDLVMLDHEGYLALYERRRRNGRLELMPGSRIFLDESGKPLMLSAGRAGKSGRRKIELADWDGDGDLDLIVDSSMNAAWYENTGSQQRPVFEPRGDLAGRALSGHNPAPNVADWNGDGRLDLLIGAEDGHFYFFDRRYLDARE
jgi:hypothetical protein